MTHDLEFMIADVLSMIEEDGFAHVPTWADLHDHVDANEYVNEAIDAARQNDETIPTTGPEWLALANALADAVSDRIRVLARA